MVTATPYHDAIRKLRAFYPALNNLLSPLPSAHNDYSRMGRAAVIEFLDCDKSNEVLQHHQHFANASSLRQYLDSQRTCRRRLFLLEDLSPSFVEVFGQYLNIDPRLFASQSRCVHWDNPVVGLQRTLRSCRKHDQDNPCSFTLRYYEPWVFSQPPQDGTLSAELLQLQPSYIAHAVYSRRVERSPGPVRLIRSKIAGGINQLTVASSNKVKIVVTSQSQYETGFSTWSALDTEKTWVSNDDPDQPAVYLLRCNASYWCRSYGDQVGSWDGLCLLDPGLNINSLRGDSKPSTIKRYQGGHPYLLQMPTNNMTISSRLQQSLRLSMFDDILHYWETDPSWRSNIHEPRAAAVYLKQLVAAHWNSTSNQVWGSICYGEVGNIEEFLSLHPEDREERARWSLMEVNLKHVNTIRRRLSYYVNEARENLHELRIEPRHSGSELDDLEKDYLDIYARLELYKSNAESIMNLTGNIASLLQAKRSLVSSYFVNLLTMVGIVILPLTFLCAVFSMEGKFQVGQQMFWVYWVIAIPLALLTIGLVWVGKKRFKVKQQNMVPF